MSDDHRGGKNDSCHPPDVGANGSFRCFLDIFLMVGLYYLIQAFTKAVSLTAPGGVNPYDNSWRRAWEHHLWQLLLSLVFIGIFSRGVWRNWGFTLKNWRLSLNTLWKFCLVYGCLEISFLICFNVGGTQSMGQHRLTSTNVVAWLAFAWLMPGLSEETLFRGLMHSYLRRSLPRVWCWRQLEIPMAGCVTALIFTLAHVNFTFIPFRLIHADALQLITAFVLGIYYSIVYHGTGSLLNPILAHNFTDGIVFSFLYISAMFR
jgi:membrane protease YdiL (CAAX protease family)